MGRFLFLTFIIVVYAVSFAVSVEANTISFIQHLPDGDTLEGLDGDVSSWTSSDNIDRLIFYVEPNQSYTQGSDPAILEIELEPIPEPNTLILIFIGSFIIRLFTVAKCEF